VKVRNLLTALRAAGGTPIRCRGSHQQWRFPDGQQVTVVVNHMNAEASKVVLASVRRIVDLPRRCG
jgi:predicted RNA binding protein YcfA (HicA-like mRNA interferase family)